MDHQKAVANAVISAVQTTDRTATRLNRLVSTKSGLDIALSNIGYGSHILHYLLSSSPLVRIRLLIRLWLLRRLGRDISVAPPSVDSSSAKPLLVLADLISKARYTIRLLSLLSVWSWGSSTYKSPPKDQILRAIAYSEVLSIFLYQALENVTYLASNGIAFQNFVKKTGGIGKWTLWSIRAWFGYVLLQFARLAREAVLFEQKEEERKRKRAEQQLSNGEKSVDLEEDEAEIEAAQQTEIRNWRKKLASNVAWAPLCAHWSFEKGLGVPSSLTGFISLLAGLWGTYDAWEATATP